MFTRLALTSAVAIASAVGSAAAADLPSRQATPVLVLPPAFSWGGFYIGAFGGGGSGQSRFADPFGRSIYGDDVRTPFVEGGGQVGYNFQAPSSHFVFGLEADGGIARSTATNTCLAFSGFVVPGNCHVGIDALATGTGRVGYAFGPEGRTLAYVKGGVAAMFGRRDIESNASFEFLGPYGTTVSSDRIGYTVGAGIEQALFGPWSIKAEYDYADFGSSGIGTPLSLRGSNTGAVAFFPRGRTQVDQDLHELKVGLNYRFGANAGPGGFFGSSAEALLFAPGALAQTPGSLAAGGYAIEAGGRYWYSFGRFQKDLGAAHERPDALVSRLTYNDQSNSGEFFGRIDTPANVFVKGFIGAGGEASGHQNDEDFLIAANIPYSNTASSQRGTLDYATVDLGYSVLKAGRSNLGVFAGYNYYKDDKAALGCRQIANQNSDCAGNQAEPTSVVGITENDRYNSLRVGVNGDMWMNQVRLQADAAYLPYVSFKGTDTHLQRTDVANQVSPQFGHGQGVQLELIASYYFTPRFSVGVGGRYWAMWIPNASTDIFSSGTIAPLPVRAERYGVMAQAAYRFETAPAPVVAKY